MPLTRRSFLGNLGHGALLACAGSALADGLGAAVRVGAPRRRLPADLEQIVRLMQDTAPDALMRQCVTLLRDGTPLRTLVAAGALANARSFGGEDYEGYHAEMALLPALQMAAEMSGRLSPLPVLKVLYRSTARIQKAARGQQRLQPVEAAAGGADAGAALQQLVRDRAMAGSEQLFAGVCARGSATDAFAALQPTLRDDLNVHRIVLAWRAWDMLPLVGDEHAHTMLRQFVRFCVDEEQSRVTKGRSEPAVRTVVPKLLERHHLLAKPPGTKTLDETGLGELVAAVFRGSREQAADAIGAALSDGCALEEAGEAISLAANELLLHDPGEQRVHGASVGVHAADAANAWRNVARVGAWEHRVANLLVAAFHTGGQSDRVAREPYAFADQLQALGDERRPGELIAAAQRAVEQKDQRAACAAVARYGELGHAADPMFDALRGYAVSEDGALHAEKYYWTAREEFGRTRPEWRWRRVVALARVTASEFGERAPGHDLTVKLLEA